LDIGILAKLHWGHTLIYATTFLLYLLGRDNSKLKRRVKVCITHRSLTMLIIKYHTYTHMPYTIILDCSEEKKYISHQVLV